MEDWGVIRGKKYDDYDENCFGSIDIKKEYDQALIFSFPHLFDDHASTSTIQSQTSLVVGNDNFDQFYKPTYPNTLELPHHNSQQVKQEVFRKTCSPQIQAPKLKKRKNQQKKEVVQVSADGLSSDLWAWRKYGQKPIKGSPYPRSYYRCSSSKGCLARRQVEQSSTDPSIFLVTYTAEHNHAQPTRRNSLAGINRNKFKTTPKSPTISDGCKIVTKSKDSPVCSPTTPSFSSMDEEVFQSQNPIKQEILNYNDFNNQELKMIEGFNDENDFVIPDIVFSDDFFFELEDLGGLNAELSSSYNYSNKQFPRGFC